MKVGTGVDTDPPLKALAKELRNADKELAKGLAKVNQEAARIIVDESQSRAPGESRIANCYQIYRGYPLLEEKLRGLGADVSVLGMALEGVRDLRSTRNVVVVASCSWRASHTGTPASEAPMAATKVPSRL